MRKLSMMDGETTTENQRHEWKKNEVHIRSEDVVGFENCSLLWIHVCKCDRRFRVVQP